MRAIIHGSFSSIGRSRGARGIVRMMTRLALAGPLLFGGCAEMDALRQTVEVQDQEIDKLRKENAAFQEAYYDIDALRATETNALKEQIVFVRRDLENAKNLQSERERQLDDELRKLALEGESERVASEARAERDATDLANANQRLTRGDRDRTRLRTRIAELDAIIDQGQKHIGELQGQLDESDTMVQSLEGSKTDTEGLLGRERESRRAAETSLAELRGKFQATQQDLQQARKDNESMTRAMGSAETTTASLDAANERIAKLVAESETLGRRIEELETELKGSPGTGLAVDLELTQAAKQIIERLANVEEGRRVTVRVDERGLRLIVPSDLAFRRSTVILSEAAKPILIDLAEAISSLTPGRHVRIEGHTDNQPVLDLPFPDNWGLGAARADRVRQFLVNEGRLDPASLELVTRSHHDPMEPNDTPEGRAKNRRVEIVVGRPID